MNLAFIYKNHDTLRYVTFLYTKIQTLRKKQDNLRYVFIHKNPDTLRYTIFMECLKLAEGGWDYMQKTMHFALHLYLQKIMHFEVRLV